MCSISGNQVLYFGKRKFGASLRYTKIAGENTPAIGYVIIGYVFQMRF